VLNHRAHHRFADVAGQDPHSPYEYPGWRGSRGCCGRIPLAFWPLYGWNAVLIAGALRTAALMTATGNHSWHHADPACPRHGRRVALDAEAVAAGVRPDRGWHPDATWRLIQLLAMLGLIYNVKKPKVTIHFADMQLVPSQPLRQTHREWHIQEPPETQRLLAA
jgi:fatty-acid desaturase